MVLTPVFAMVSNATEGVVAELLKCRGIRHCGCDYAKARFGKVPFPNKIVEERVNNLQFSRVVAKYLMMTVIRD